MKIRQFFHLFLLLSVIVPLIGIGGISLFISSGILKKEILLSSRRQICFFSDRIEQYLEVPVDMIRVLGNQLTSDPEPSVDEKRRIMKSFVDSFDIITSIQVAGYDGRVEDLYPVDDLFLGSDVSGHEYFRTVKNNGTLFWSPSRMSEVLDTPVTTLSFPTSRGIITLALSLNAVSTMLYEGDTEDAGLILYITDQNGVYIAHTDSRKVLLQEYDREYISFKKKGFEEQLSNLEYDGVLYTGYYKMLDDSGWMVALLQPRSVINKPIRAIVISLSILTFIVLTLALLFSAFLQKSLSSPVMSMADIAGQIAGGSYELSLPESAIEEFNLLNRSILSMSRQIRMREEALKRTRTYLSNVIDSMPSVLIGIKSNLEITQWNRRAVEQTGIEPAVAIGCLLPDVLPKIFIDIPLIRQAIENRKMQVFTRRTTAVDGRKEIENIIVYPLESLELEGAVIRVDNVTDKVRMEELLIQNEKMLSIGGLAAGMAHEINNPLAGMIQTASVLSTRLGLEKKISANESAAAESCISLEAMKNYLELREIPAMLNSLNNSGRRIAEIVANMLSFVRTNDEGSSTHDINEIFDTALELAVSDYNLRKKYDFRQIEIIRNYGENIPGVICEKSKIQQVFFNILQNGAHAMYDYNRENPRFIISSGFDSKSRMVVVKISDNGPGMEESVRKRIFEPFFTTKPVGIGTGLGLSVSYFIITENQKGEIEVDSAPGEGSTFTIKLPARL